MSRFAASKIAFGARREPIDGKTLKAEARRYERVRDAGEILRHLPNRGESFHFLLQKRFDLMDVASALPATIGKIHHIRLVTLSYNTDNLVAMLDLIDSGNASRLSLLCSSFLRGHKPELWQSALAGFAARPVCRIASAETHAKVVLAHSERVKLTIEGSANLSSNGGIEQIALIADDGLHDWHAAWIDELMDRNDSDG